MPQQGYSPEVARIHRELAAATAHDLAGALGCASTEIEPALLALLRAGFQATFPYVLAALDTSGRGPRG